jgi:hypothetical protein
MRPIAQSMILPGKEKMNKIIMDYFNKGDSDSSNQFIMINSIALAASHMIVICRKKLAPYLSEIHNETLAIGVADFLSNKGSVCISFKLGNLRLLFVNCHLEAHEKNLTKRNEQWN